MMLLALLGLALVLVLIYCEVTGTALPKGVRLIILIALGLFVLWCFLEQAGCDLSSLLPKPTPH